MREIYKKEIIDLSMLSNSQNLHVSWSIIFIAYYTCNCFLSVSTDQPLRSEWDALFTHSFFASDCVFLTASTLSNTFTFSLSLFFLTFSQHLSQLLTLGRCQSVRRAGETHSQPQGVTQSGHCQQGLLTACRSLSRAETRDKLDPYSGESRSEEPGVAAKTGRIVINSTAQLPGTKLHERLCKTNHLQFPGVAMH